MMCSCDVCAQDGKISVTGNVFNLNTAFADGGSLWMGTPVTAAGTPTTDANGSPTADLVVESNKFLSGNVRPSHPILMLINPAWQSALALRAMWCMRYSGSDMRFVRAGLQSGPNGNNGGGGAIATVNMFSNVFRSNYFFNNSAGSFGGGVMHIFGIPSVTTYILEDNEYESQ